MLTVGAAIVHLAIGWMEEGHFSWIASGHGSAIGVFLLWIIVLLSALASLWSSGFRSRPMMGCVAIAVAGVALIR